MNVCIVTSSYPANPSDVAAPFAADFARAVKRRGHNVFVVAPERPGIQQSADGVSVLWIPRHGATKAIVQTKLTSPKEVWGTIQLLRDGERLLLRTVREHSIDVCFALWVIPGGYLAWRVGRRTGIPYAVWALGSDINTFARYPMVRSLIKRILKRARLRFANSQVLAERVKELTGADCQLLPATRTLPVSGHRLDLPGRVRFLFLGRLERVKGVDVLLDAMARLKSDDGIHLYVLGGGSLEGQLVSQIAAAGLQEVVTMVSSPPNDVVASYFASCDCLVIPSRSESLPVVFAEAVQAGIPLLVTETGDMGRLARKHGLMPPVPPEDAAALAEAMRQFAADPAGQQRRFEAARAELLDLFDPDAGADRFLVAFHSS
jgi:glycosyltransferase involved in cell wall biosynthesis